MEASLLPLPFRAPGSLVTLPLQKSMPAEEAHFINTKQLKFLLARSRWQVGPPFPGEGC